MKKQTVIRFLGIHTVSFFIVMLTGMCLLFTYTINKAHYDAVKGMLIREAARVSRHIVRQEDGTISIAQNVLEDMDLCSVAVISADGSIISGDIPEDVSEKAGVAVKHGKPRSISVDGREYYVLERRVMNLRSEKADLKQNKGDEKEQHGKPEKKNGPHNIYVRAVLCSDDFKTIYNDIERFFYFFVALLVLVAVLGGGLIYKNAARPVREMCDSVKKLASDPDYSDRIDNTSMFYETEVMRDAYNKLMDRNERLISQQEEFNENVSHELRTPVAVIRSETELLQNLYGDILPDEAAKSLSVIHKQSDRINAMIAELRYMAKMDRENFALKKEMIDLSDIAESVCEDMDDVTLDGCRFSYHWEPAEANIDVALMVVAVRNLILNAVKFSPSGSVIDLYTGVRGGSGAEAGNSEASSSDHGTAYFKVSDHGIGIPQHDLEKIFEPYYQVKTERNSEGFGLGLTLVMKVAAKHGGTVTAESEEGKGSTFTLMLPVM